MSTETALVTLETPELAALDWRRVEGWPYEVSEEGRIRRVALGRRGDGPGAILTPQLNSSGYYRVMLSDNQRTQRVFVHRAVAAAFIGPLPRGIDVHHIDNDKLNNRVSNLRLVTRGENHRLAYRDGVRKPAAVHGSRHANSKLSEDNVSEIRKAYASREANACDLAGRHGVSQTLIYRIVTRKTWRHVP